MCEQGCAHFGGLDICLCVYKGMRTLVDIYECGCVDVSMGVRTGERGEGPRLPKNCSSENS